MNGIDWEVKYWLEDYTKYNDTDALIRQRIWYVFKREKIDFAYPVMSLRRVDKPVEVPPEEVANTITERLTEIPIFAPLSDDEMLQLVKASKSRIYAPGEAIVRKGQEGNSMFVILRGSVKVQIPENDYQKTVNHLGENDFFGEMSLLTGEPRSASVIAEEETDVLQIKKDALKPIFENNPTLVQAICELIEERREVLVAETLADAEEHSGNR
jgi:signal-transduction protein with cAMP-binding, CBS, and nucleotidyltransferase domain